MSGARTAALIPAFNEAGTVAEVVSELHGIVDTILVVDDGSTDDTAASAQRAGADVIVHTTNCGKGTAIRTGLARVLAGDYSYVLLLDADMQHLPHEAPRLIDAMVTTGADVVIGERMFNREQMPASRYHTNRLGSRALSAFVGVPVGDTQCGFRLFRVAVLRGLALSATGYEIETEMLIKVRRRGGLVTSAPVTAVYNGRRSKLRPIRDTTRTCFLAVYYRYIERL
jgi:glycosyltransferase involved in cell wall biosynthesis